MVRIELTGNREIPSITFTSLTSRLQKEGGALNNGGNYTVSFMKEGCICSTQTLSVLVSYCCCNKLPQT